MISANTRIKKATIKNNNCWYHYDDTNVQKVSESKVISSKAYCLFYKKYRYKYKYNYKTKYKYKYETQMQIQVEAIS